MKCSEDLFGWRHLIHRTRFKRLMSICNIVVGEKIADIGCAQGSFTCEFQRRGAEAYGIDVINYPEGSRNYCGLNPKYYTASIYELPFQDGYFDKAFLSEMIIALDNPIKGLSEVNRVLKTGGVLILSNSRGYDVFDDFFFSSNIFYKFSRFLLRKLLKKNKNEFNPQEERRRLAVYLGCNENRIQNYSETETEEMLRLSGFELVAKHYEFKALNSFLLGYILVFKILLGESGYDCIRQMDMWFLFPLFVIFEKIDRHNGSGVIYIAKKAAV